MPFSRCYYKLISLLEKMLRVSTGNARESSNGSEGEEARSYRTSTPNKSDPWPFRIKLTTDHMRWDGLKILPSKEFEEFILNHMNEKSRKALDLWIPVNISIFDVDTGETYNVKLAKKESFWFDPMPYLREKPTMGNHPAYLREPPCYDLDHARRKFAYSIEPFRHLAKRRNLNYDQEIGLRFSGSEVMDGFEFSILHSPLLDINCFRV